MQLVVLNPEQLSEGHCACHVLNSVSCTLLDFKAEVQSARLYLKGGLGTKHTVRKNVTFLDMVAHALNPRTKEAKTRESV